jgi:hypothetical protein
LKQRHAGVVLMERLYLYDTIARWAADPRRAVFDSEEARGSGDAG